MFGLDDKQNKRIANRVDWITACAVIAIQYITKKFWPDLQAQFPPPPDPNNQNAETTSS